MPTSVKEKPIIFSTPMVQAIIGGRKTQTRRVIKPQPVLAEDYGLWLWQRNNYWNKTFAQVDWVVDKPAPEYVLKFCPYGQVGDRLWVRETHYHYGHWAKNGLTKTGKQRWRFVSSGYRRVNYFDYPPNNIKPNSYRLDGWYKRPSLFMPRWASRITLEITGVRAGVQEIIEDDAQAEGVL